MPTDGTAPLSAMGVDVSTDESFKPEFPNLSKEMDSQQRQATKKQACLLC